MQPWPWGTFRDKLHEKNPVKNTLVAFSRFSAQQLPSLIITLLGDINTDLMKSNSNATIFRSRQFWLRLTILIFSVDFTLTCSYFVLMTTAK